MKAHKYHRFSQGHQISMQSFSLSETIFYLPEIKRILYKGYDGYKMKDYFGVCEKGSEDETRILEEAEAYVSEIKSGTIKPHVSEEEVQKLPLAVSGIRSNIYSTTPGKVERVSDKKFYIKKIGESKSYGDRQELILSNYEEVDLDITEYDLNKIESNKKALEEIKAANKKLKKQIFK